MGNCQAIDAECIVLQRPGGKEERVYWSVSAGKVMRMNPGHHVAQILSTTTFGPQRCHRLTRIKLLRPHEMLLLGHVYRLITVKEVMKGLLAKKNAKMKQILPHGVQTVQRSSESEKANQTAKNENARNRATMIQGGRKSRTWQPSLQSISEAAS